MFLNEYEVQEAVQRFSRGSTPNLQRGAQALNGLVEWANSHSDGWAYWPKPGRAAASLQSLLAGVDRFDPQDVSESELKAALRPVKAFLTRQGVAHAEVLEG